MTRQRVFRNAQGFTLIEVLVAMTIFSIASLGTARVLNSTMQANIMAHHRTFATALAQDKVEEIRAGVAGACAAATASQGAVTFSLTCNSVASLHGSSEVTVQVTWNYPSSQSVRLQIRM